MNARDGARWSSRQRWKNDALYRAASLAIGLGLCLPRSLLPGMGKLLGSLSYFALGRARATTIENLSLAYPALSLVERRAMAHRIFRYLGQSLTDAVSLLDAREPAGRTLALPPESAAALACALERRRGVIFVTAHLGPWERMAGLLAERGFPITTVARESYDRRFHPLVYDRLRTARSIEVIYRGAPGMPAALVRALRRGRVLGFFLDMPGRVPTRPVVLLGQASRAPVGPARLALRLRTPIVIGTPAPGPGNVPEIHIAPLFAEDLSPGEAGEAELTQRMVDALSHRIRAWPAAWPWMHPSFGGAPTAQAALAALTGMPSPHG